MPPLPVPFPSAGRRARRLVGAAWALSALFSLPMFYLYETRTIEGLWALAPWGRGSAATNHLHSACRPDPVLDRVGQSGSLEAVHVAGVGGSVRVASTDNFCLLRGHPAHHLGQGSHSGTFG